MARSCLAKRLLLACLAVHAGQFPSAWADLQAGVSVYSRDDYSSATAAEFRLLAFQGDPHAQTQLAHLYADGRGVPQNYREAIDWYRRAALQGYQPARAALQSLGVPLISARMVSDEVSQASEETSPRSSNADALPGQASHGRNTVTINIITNVDAPSGRRIDEVRGINSVILHPRNQFKARRHSRHRHADTKPVFRIGKSALPANPGTHQKPYPHTGAGRAHSRSPGFGRIPTR